MTLFFLLPNIKPLLLFSFLFPTMSNINILVLLIMLILGIILVLVIILLIMLTWVAEELNCPHS